MTLTDGAADSWIRRFHPAPDARVRLVCLPHAGGSASYWYPMSAATAAGIEVLAVQYPGRQDRRHEPCVETVEALAEQVTEALLPHRDLPLALFGHSMGAVVGFEVARRLEDLGTPPVALFASGRRAPSRHRDEDVHLRGVDGIVAELRKLDGTDPRALQDPELLRMILPAVRADYKAVETYRYRPGPPLSCPVDVLVGDSDEKATVDEAGSWRDHTTGGSALHVFPGGHFYLAHHQGEIVRIVTDRLLPPVS
ncbi:thioesterase [Kitasatospora xanthocidica]|uniref:Thioesterase n=1 Tax=Kitasatospora xanthocidica TaxID=83382 RepID=A0A373A263_9ACTN|nr:MULTISPECIES: alpha/beta fold hydrolase [Streptomycetaceae]OKI03069.1 oleoyl-ACP hydrolase [Streptomyces sp. CB02056]RGD62151.1 thioesterase [Kitasatospora xanthocidica]